MILFLEECLEALERHIDVELCNDLKRSVHREDGHAHIDHFNAKICDIFCDGSSAALVDLAELAGLPHDLLAVEESADLCDELRVCVVCRALAPCAGVFGDDDALVEVGGVELIVNRGIGGVER